MNSKATPPLIMGILNITPDSFSDGGQYNKPEEAVQRALEMLEEGADIIDIGGESTRPGAESVSSKEQIKRVVAVIEGIRKTTDALISIDTTHVEVARAALNTGANWINDVSAGEDALLGSKKNGSEEMLLLAAEMNVPIVLMHRQGVSRTMQDDPQYDDVVQEVCDYLQERASIAIKNGVPEENIILDPGIGFGKLLDHNLALMADLSALVALDYPVLLGSSRKRFLGEIIKEDDPEKRIAATCATTALGVNAGVEIFRVHDVIENRHAADIAWAVKNA